MSLSSAELEYYGMARCASEAIGLTNTVRGLALRSGSGAIKDMDKKILLASAEREEPGAQDRENPWHSQSRRLNNIKHIGGQPSSDDGH